MFLNMEDNILLKKESQREERDILKENLFTVFINLS